MRMLQIEEVNSVSGGANDGLFVIQNQATWGTQFSGGTAFGSAPGISGFDGFKTWLEGQGVMLEDGSELEEVVVTATREVVTVQEVLTWAAMICGVAAAIYAAPLLMAGAAGTTAAAWAYALASAGFGALAAYLDYIDGKP